MLKRILFAVVPMTMLLAGVRAEDSDLTIDVASITDATAEITEASLDVDVDKLASETEIGTKKVADAIEACFRSCGYYGGYNNWNCGYSNWGCSYTSYCYQPCYSTFYYVRPVYQCTYAVAPICSYYWGCY